MAEETLRYKIEIDEASLQSELARTRGAITGVLSEAISTGRYALNSVQSDLRSARQDIVQTASDTAVSPTTELAQVTSALSAAGLGPTQFYPSSQTEAQLRGGMVATAIAREAVPIGAGVAGGLLGMKFAKGPIGAIAAGGLGYLGGMAAMALPAGEMEARQVASSILDVTRAPSAMAPFTKAERTDLTRGLSQDVADDVRFSTDELNGLLSGGIAGGQFTGARSVEEFRGRFRNMMDQLKSITRVFKESTEEAIQTLSEVNQYGAASPGVVQGRLADVMNISSANQIAPQEALAFGTAGAELARQRGIPMAKGMDFGLRSAAMATTAGQMLDPVAYEQMGGVRGLSAIAMQAQFGAANFPAMKSVLAGLANENMTGLDPTMAQAYAEGAIGYEEVASIAKSRMSDRATRLRFSTNQDLIRDQLATSNLALPALYQTAEGIGGRMNVPAQDVFMNMASQMGLNPMQRQYALAFGRNFQEIEESSARNRQMATYNLQLADHIEGSRFTSKLAAKIEGLGSSVATAIGEPISEIGGFFSGLFDDVMALPGKAMRYMDRAMGTAFFGAPPGRPVPVWSRMDLTSYMDLDRQSNYLKYQDLKGVGSQAASAKSLSDIKIISTQKSKENLMDAVTTIMDRVEPFRDIKVFDRIAERASESGVEGAEETAEGTIQGLKEEVISRFADELGELANEPDIAKREEMKGKLRGKIEGWFNINLGHLTEDKEAEAKKFVDQVMEISTVAERDNQIHRGLQKAAGAVASMQVSMYATEDLPAVLQASAKDIAAQDELSGIAVNIGKNFKGRPALASLHAMEALGTKALPHLRGKSPLAQRIGVAQKLMEGGFLNSQDLMVSKEELETVRDQDTSATQRRYIDELIKAASKAEGHELSADVVFRSLGFNLGGGQNSSSTPSPGAQTGDAKWDMTATVLDRLTKATDSLYHSSKKLMDSLSENDKKAAGKV